MVSGEWPKIERLKLRNNYWLPATWNQKTWSIIMGKIFLFIIFLLIEGSIWAEQLYVNPKTGNDTNPGTRAAPLKTISEAAKRVNANKDKGSTEIILTEGVHILTETALFNNNKYSLTDRLVIRAEVMPDDTGWQPQLMPIIITIVPMSPGFGGVEAYGLKMEVSHATIAGLRFTGSPDYSYMTDTSIRRSYPIWRDGKSLDDLLVTQCMFTGAKEWR